MVGVAGEALDAVADGVVVHDLALCVGSAHSRAWVDALLQRTRLVMSAVVVGCAFRTTADDGVALVARHTAADWHAGVVATLGVGAARGRFAGSALGFKHRWSRRPLCKLHAHTQHHQSMKFVKRGAYLVGYSLTDGGYRPTENSFQ